MNKSIGSKASSPLHFARYEFKYILSAEKREAVENDLFFFLDYDPFVESQPGHRYFVRSLYFDSPTFTAFHDKIDGVKSRYKFRARTYSDSPAEDVPLFLEIKGRHNNLVYKHRTPVGQTIDWRTISHAQVGYELQKHASPSTVADQFRYDLLRKSLRPVALIDYQRRPYISKYDPNFRITFDEQLRATHTSQLFSNWSPAPRRILAGYTVVEVKFRHHLPAWFHQVIQAHELRRVSISKIVAGMERLNLAHDEQ